jgi:hypothetical protein
MKLFYEKIPDIIFTSDRETSNLMSSLSFVPIPVLTLFQIHFIQI